MIDVPVCECVCVGVRKGVCVRVREEEDNNEEVWKKRMKREVNG